MTETRFEDNLPAADIRARLSAPTQSVVAWAAGTRRLRDAPHRLLLSSNESGKTLVYAWDRIGNTRRPLPPEAKPGYTFLAPSGDSIVYVHDSNDSEVGHLMRLGWGVGGELSAPQPVAPPEVLPPLYVYGLQIGRDGTLYFAGSGKGVFRIYRVETEGKAGILYEHENEAYLPYLSADETMLAFCTSERENNRHWQATVVDARTGERIAQLSEGDEFSVTPARWLMGAADVRPWSPIPGDTRLLITSNRTGGDRAAGWNVRTGERIDLAQDFDEILPHGWTADAKTILLRQVSGGRTRLWRCDADTGANLSPIPHVEGTLSPLPVFPNGELWYGFSRLAEPPQTRAVNVDAPDMGETVILPPTITVDKPLPRWESVVFTSVDSTPIHGFLGIPEGDGPFPALLYLHGGPTAQVTDAYMPSWNDLLKRGYIVFAINFRGSTGYGRTFQEAINGQPGRLEIEDMAAARQYLIEHKWADPERIGLMGGSYGGFLTLMGLTRQPELWALGYATVPLCDWAMMYEDANQRLRGWARTLLGGTPDERPDTCRDCSPVTRAERIRAPLRIVAHKSDTRCPIRQVEAFLSRLDACGIPYEAEISEGGHGTRSVEEIIHHHEMLVDFADRHLKRPPSPNNGGAGIGKPSPLAPPLLGDGGN